MTNSLRRIGVAIYGGLGNQMFQYASALGVARHHNASLFLDLSWFEVSEKLSNTTPRSFALEVFNIDYEESSFLFSEKSISFFGRCKRRISRIFPAISREKIIYSEKQFSFDRDVFEACPPFLLNGYWQSEKYFSGVYENILQLFGTPNNLSTKTSLMMDRIAGKDAICVHIRRGDYVTNPVAAETHGLCGVEYYLEGIQTIAQNLSHPHCFIFSDDIQWARANLLTNIPMTFVDFNSQTEAHQDLWLMAACKHFVIANSSLSWWGAYLGRYPGKKVIAPKHWFRDKSLNTEDLYLADWIRI